MPCPDSVPAASCSTTSVVSAAIPASADGGRANRLLIPRWLHKVDPCRRRVGTRASEGRLQSWFLRTASVATAGHPAVKTPSRPNAPKRPSGDHPSTGRRFRERVGSLRQVGRFPATRKPVIECSANQKTLADYRRPNGPTFIAQETVRDLETRVTRFRRESIRRGVGQLKVCRAEPVPSTLRTS
jgi:hypothetical protein